MIDFQTASRDLFARHGEGFCGLEFAQAYTSLMDSLLIDLFQKAMAESSAPGKAALVALGGYGRGDLAPYSDVDLLVLTGSPSRGSDWNPLVEAVLYPLWDLKLDVGHSVRTAGECLNMAGSEFTILVSLLDARFLAGDEELFAGMEGMIARWLGAKSSKKIFFDKLRASVGVRYKKYGESLYLLEPNVKEGQGGLRDLHTIFWGGEGLFNIKKLDKLAAQGFLPVDRLDDLRAAHAFMARVRSHLHMLGGEKADTLTFDLQERLPEIFHFEDDGVSGVERFMQEYYTRVYQTKSALSFFLSRMEESIRPAKLWRMTQRSRTVERGVRIRRGLVELAGSAEVRQRPIIMMKAFEAASNEGLQIGQNSLEIIRANLDLIDDEYRRDPEAAKSFLRALAAVPPSTVTAPKNLEAMHGVNFLAAFIPELARVRARVQHDAYHVYTVDVHLVLTLWELKKIAAGVMDERAKSDDRSVMDQVRDREVLALAALVHDIGKGQGRDHARRGAEIVPEIGARLGLGPERIETLAFLVAEHLFLIETATRRDLSEEKLIVNCARRVGDVERLHMLYLLTVADSRATGPGAWNQWKAGLLRELYSKTLTILTRSDLGEKGAAKRSERLRAEVKSLLKDSLSPEEVDAHFDNMSAHYLSMTGARRIARHIQLERRLKDEPVIWEMEARDDDHCEVIIMTRDRPGLLSRLAGVFTLHNINIMGSQAFTRRNQVAMDVFQVKHPPDRLFAEEAWAKVKRDTLRALTGHLALDFRLASKSPLLEIKPTGPRRPSRVVIDNDTSDFFTIVEVFTHDRLGLLYKLTKALFDLQLSIYVAKISTKVDQVVDVFYVRDFFDQKLLDKEQIKEIKDAIVFTIES
ncbi:MAG: [protein-PII] uridylyltransferase [Thermodesulfobacteriota bacterium]|nr:[protein-PII] uridylyltransferase [Thermodesulfobacteriota bacterium]